MLFGAFTPSLIANNYDNNSSVDFNFEGYYISGLFKVTDGDWSCVITLKSDGTFTMVQREGRDIESTSGTYTLSDNVSKGEQAELKLYSNGNLIGTGLLAWPMEERLCIIMEGYVLYKM